MSLVRYTPTPSDRMSAIWTMLSIKGAVVLEYGPAGTTRFAKRNMSSLGLDTEQLIATHLSEDDVIMGDVTRLEKALRAVDRDYHPEVIFVVPSSILAVTGADITGVCYYMQEEVNAKLIPYVSGGFTGDYSVGLRAMYKLLMENLNEPVQAKADNTYNILGVCAYTPGVQQDLSELNRLMSRAFGAKLIAAPGLNSSVESLRRASQAAVNLVIRDEALPAAKWMEEKWGIPYVYPAPYGYEGTLLWLDAVSKALGKEPSADLTQEIQGRIAKVKGMPGNGGSVSIVGDYDLVVGLASFAASLGFTVDKLICRHDIAAIENPVAGVQYFKTEKEVITALQDLSGQRVIGDEVAVQVCSQKNKVLPLLPPSRQSRGQEGASSMGLKGTDYIADFLL